MHRYLYVFRRTLNLLGTGRTVLLALALFLNSLLEAFGIATLVPLLASMLGDEQAHSSSLARHVHDVLAMLGLPQETHVLVLLTTSILVSREIISFLILSWAGFIIAETERRLRHHMLGAIMQARWPWYQDNRLGEMAVSLAQFTTAAASAMDRGVRSLALLLRLTVYLWLIIFISPTLMAIVLLLAAVLFMPLLAILRLTRKFSAKHAALIADLSATFTDIMASIKMFKAMGLEDKVQPVLERLNRRMRKFRRRLVLTNQGLVALQNILGIVLLFSVLYVATQWLNISAVEIGVVAGLVISMARHLGKMQNMLQKMAESLPYLMRIDNIMSSAQAAREILARGSEPSFADSIDLQAVSFAHPGRSVLRDVSIRFPAHAISVIIGPSGAGKTTIIDLITGLQQPQEGAILVDGVPLREIDLKAWREMIGYVPQELILLSGTVRDNIRLGQDVSDEDIWRALRLAGAEEFIRELPEGLDTDLGERGVKLSGGQRQRLSLARALVRKPKLLILDEVTSALDPQTERQLVESVAELARREGITVIAITHTQAWRKVADVLVRLENGKAESCQPKVKDSCPEKT